MDQQFGHPSSQPLLESVANVFKEKEIYATNDRRIIFVCGGNDKRNNPAVRTKFLTYAKRNLKDLRIFLAEDAAKDLLSHDKPRFLNVAEFEDLIAEISDCILIFPESPGSIAELAYFSHNEKVREKILVVNRDQLQAEDSFLNMGPLALVDKESIFRPTIQINYKKPKFLLVKKRLSRHFPIPSQNREKINFADSKRISAREKFFTVYEIVKIFGVINLNGLCKCMEALLGEANREEMARYLSILITAGYIVRKKGDRQYVVPKAGAPAFLEIDNFDARALMTRVASYYRKHEPKVAKLLGGVVR